MESEGNSPRLTTCQTLLSNGLPNQKYKSYNSSKMNRRWRLLRGGVGGSKLCEAINYTVAGSELKPNRLSHLGEKKKKKRLRSSVSNAAKNDV